MIPSFRQISRESCAKNVNAIKFEAPSLRELLAIDYTLKALEIADTRHGTAKLRRLIIQPGELLCM